MERKPRRASRRYHGERDAGITGFSHIGLCTTDAARDEAFWTNVCSAFSAFITKPFQMSLRHRVAPEYASLSAALHPHSQNPFDDIFFALFAVGYLQSVQRCYAADWLPVRFDANGAALAIIFDQIIFRLRVWIGDIFLDVPAGLANVFQRACRAPTRFLARKVRLHRRY